MNIKKHHLFSKELGFISDNNKREFCEICLNGLPSYFWVVPASSTGKYHPSYSLGEGGLVRHIKGAVRIAVELFNCNSCFNFTKEEQDNIIISLLLHDGFKSGSQDDYNNSKYTKHEHPLLASAYVEKVYASHQDLIDYEDIKVISDCISSHMGQWNTNNYSKYVLPRPKNTIQRFIHLVDYLGSRKLLEVNFDV